MKRSLPMGPKGAAASPKRTAAFTLAEMMTTAAVFALLVAAALCLQLFGLRTYTIAHAKLAAADNSRKGLNQVRDEVRSGKLLYVGNGNASAFSFLPDNTPRVGNALMIYPTPQTNTFTYYFVDTNGCCLNRMTSGSTRVEVLSQFVTNVLAFQAEDFQGNVATNDVNNRVIRITLQFYQWEYPILQAGINCRYDYYQIQTCMARRLIE